MEPTPGVTKRSFLLEIAVGVLLSGIAAVGLLVLVQLDPTIGSAFAASDRGTSYAIDATDRTWSQPGVRSAR